MSDQHLEIASTLQSASLKTDPSPAHDTNPRTATNPEKQPATVEPTPAPAPAPAPAKPQSQSQSPSSIPSDIVDANRTVRTISRQRRFPPLPDLRFEQSYLASLKDADSWGRVAWITIRDQVLLPLFQGTLWTLALSGWRYWNRSAAVGGRSLGGRLRKWWYEVNNWELPPVMKRGLGSNYSTQL